MTHYHWIRPHHSADEKFLKAQPSAAGCTDTNTQARYRYFDYKGSHRKASFLAVVVCAAWG